MPMCDPPTTCIIVYYIINTQMETISCTQDSMTCLLEVPKPAPSILRINGWMRRLYRYLHPIGKIMNFIQCWSRLIQSIVECTLVQCLLASCSHQRQSVMGGNAKGYCVLGWASICHVICLHRVRYIKIGICIQNGEVSQGMLLCRRCI